MGVWFNMSRSARIILILLILCAIIGPAMIIAGIVILTVEGSREEKVDDYNQEVRDYYLGVGPKLGQVTLNKRFGDNAAFDRDILQVEVWGNTDDLVEATHYVYRSSTDGSTNPESFPIQFQHDTRGDLGTLTFTAPYIRAVSEPLFCRPRFCKDDCDEIAYRCSRTMLREYCESRGNDAIWTETDDICYTNELCGGCNYTGYLTSACFVFRMDANLNPSISNLTSCQWPFDSQTYGPRNNTILLRALPEEDPEIRLLAATAGMRDFGLTDEEDQTGGLALIIVGALLLLLALLLICLMCKHYKKKTTVVVKDKNTLQSVQTAPAPREAAMPPTAAAPRSAPPVPEPLIVNQAASEHVVESANTEPYPAPEPLVVNAPGAFGEDYDPYGIVAPAGSPLMADGAATQSTMTNAAASQPILIGGAGTTPAAIEGASPLRLLAPRDPRHAVYTARVDA